MTDSNVLSFRKRTDINAELNLKEFIRFCRYDLTALGSNFNWRSNEWKGVAVFTKINVKREVKIDKKQLLDEEYIDFAKAYMRYQSALTKSRWKISASLTILKVVEQTLLMINKNANIIGVGIPVLDEAIQTIKSLYKEHPAYDYGRALQEFAKFLGENGLLSVGDISWVSPIKPPEAVNRVSRKADKARLSKLPDETALNAMAEIFSLPDEELSSRDIFTTSIFALLMCAPSRISEILALPCDCEIMEVDSSGVERYGLRFYSLKGFGADIKWIPDVMVPIARKAIERLKKLSKNAREFAQWVEKNPSEFFRRDSLPDLGENEILKPFQICEALGYNLERKNGKAKFLSRVSFYNSQQNYTMNSLWCIILSRLPEGFPWYDEDKGIKYSNALCLLNTHQLEKRNETIIYELQKPTKNIFMVDVSKNKYEHLRFENIFIRHGYTGTGGQALHLRSHQPRHLLNTIGQRNGMSDLDLAKWSGRALVTQNPVYNHVSEDEMLRKAETLDISSIGSQAFMIDSVEPNIPVTPGMLNLWEHGAVHVTEFVAIKPLCRG